jgi:hypothetical protein
VEYIELPIDSLDRYILNTINCFPMCERSNINPMLTTKMVTTSITPPQHPDYPISKSFSCQTYYRVINFRHIVITLGYLAGILSVCQLVKFHSPTNIVSSRPKSLPRNLTLQSAQLSSYSRNRNRLKRTRPTLKLVNLVQYEIKVEKKRSMLEHKRKGRKRKQKVLCGKDFQPSLQNYSLNVIDEYILDSSSRVIITNILSSAGMHLALKLSMECNVNSILGIDAMLPNNQLYRINLLDRYAMLKRRIISFQKLITPHAGVILRHDELRLQKFAPTHVVHLVQEYVTEDENPLYTLRDKSISMDQILNIVLRTQSSKPYLIYSGWNLQIERTLAAYYHVHYNINSIGLELPYLYGPWGTIGSWIWSMAEKLVDNSLTLESSSVSNNHSQFLYVEDAADAIIAAMQLNHPSLMVKFKSNVYKEILMNIIQNKNYTEGNVKESTAHSDNFPWLIETTPRKGLQRLISWHFSKSYPYGRATFKRRMPTYVMENFHYQFPCTSECSIPGSCLPSVYDEVVRNSRKITKGCRNVLYVVHLSHYLKDLPPALNIDENPPKGYTAFLCQIAIISGFSIVAQGEDIFRNWTLVRVPAEDSKMSEADFMLPKLSPGLLLDANVAKAIYLEIETLTHFTADKVVSFIRSIDSQSKRGNYVKFQRSGTPIIRWDWIRGTPARISVMLGREYAGLQSNNTISQLAKTIASEKELPINKRMNIQTEFYEHAAHLVQTTQSRRLDELQANNYKEFPFQFWNTDLIVHDLRFDEARLLRCEWYDEQVFWGTRGMEDVSLSFILAKRRVRGLHGSDENGWMPLTIPIQDDCTALERKRIKSSWGAELFLRVISQSIQVMPEVTNVDNEEEEYDDE